MKSDDILALYNLYERQTCVAPMYRREEANGVVRHTSRVPKRLSNVVYSELTAVTADAAIQAQKESLQTLDSSGITWFVYDYDVPSDLSVRLLRHGFEEDEAEPVLILDCGESAEFLQEDGRFDIRRLSQPEQIQDIISIEEQVWGGDFAWLYTQLSSYQKVHPDFISLYVAYKEDLPVSAGWIYFPEGSPFASLWGGATVEAYRRCGLYKALIAARTQEARDRGRRFLIVKATEMSRPILEKHGFWLLTTIYPFTLSKD